ncbi:MAG: 6,7-dimethyl-8-ribityllumazine synthase [Lentisphaeria bacterium]|nr:6,7-dimethyl-8-ribityllumazine synthase [Lentisphaeria bacterium]
MDKTVKNVMEGKLTSSSLKIGVVCARFNAFFVEKLLEGAVDAFVRHGGNADDLAVAWVPGSYELPFVCSKMAKSGKYDAIMCLGVVIQGATTHAAQINGQVSKAIAQIGLESGIPVLYGLVTTENIDQAIERSGTKAGNRGADVMMAAVEMANLNRDCL